LKFPFIKFLFRESHEGNRETKSTWARYHKVRTR